jgi:hypothetical protein
MVNIKYKSPAENYKTLMTTYKGVGNNEKHILRSTISLLYKLDDKK